MLVVNVNSSQKMPFWLLNRLLTHAPTKCPPVQLSDLRLSTLEIGHLQICSVTEIAPKSPFLQEGPKGVKWAPGFAYLGPGKMGLTALGLEFNHWERDVQSLNWEWDISPLTIFEYII